VALHTRLDGKSENVHMARQNTSATPREGMAPREPHDLSKIFETVANRITQGGAPLSADDFDAIRAAGSQAAERGMTAGEAVDVYLKTAAQAWSAIPPSGPGTHVAGHILLEGIRATIPLLVEGYQNAGQHLIRHEETLRREFIDDLLRGDADVTSIVQRAEPFGLDLSASHQVVLAGPRNDRLLDERDESNLDRAVVARYGHRNVLVTTKGGYLVALIPARSVGRYRSSRSAVG